MSRRQADAAPAADPSLPPPRATVEAARGLVSAAAHHTAALPLALALRRYAAAYFADGEAIFDQLDVASATEAKTPV